MQNTASFSAKSQNLGSIDPNNKPSSSLLFPLVIPAHAGIQSKQHLDSCFRRNDEVFCDTLIVGVDQLLQGGWKITGVERAFCRSWIPKYPKLKGL